MSRPVIMCVDDEPTLVLVLKEQLKRAFAGQYLIETAEDGDDALALYEELVADGLTVAVIVSDQLMPKMRGDALLAELHARDPEMLKIMLTGQASTDDVGKAVNAGGLYRFMTKPWNSEDLVLTVREALRSFERARELKAQRATLVEMSEAALELAGTLAASDRYERMAQRVTRALPADRSALFGRGAHGAHLLALCGEATLPADLDLDATLADTFASAEPEVRAEDPLWPGARAAMRVPLRVDGETVGVLALAADASRAFAAVDRDLVNGLASLAATSMRTARLVDALEASLEQRRRVSEALLRQANERVAGPLLGSSAAVRRVRDQVSTLAGHLEPVLLFGPPGAGSEAIARAIHAESAVAQHPFIAVNCATAGRLEEVLRINPQADADRVAAGGTLYLEGVNRLSVADQIELGARVVQSAARVVASVYEAARAQPGTALVESALLKAFAHRLRVPPLRLRREDVPTLAEFFLRRHATQMGRAVDWLSPQAVARLKAHDWPGNIPELSAVMQRAVAESTGNPVDVDASLLSETSELGGYRLVERIATGGMGEVWRAEHRALARPAAVKLITPEANPAQFDGLVARFKREASATARLTSPHTVEVYDYGVNDEGALFLVMELLRGIDLHTLVSRFGPQPPARVIMLLEQVCRSLDEAHRIGMVHRDIKPANLIACRLGTEFDFVKVLDFGMVTAWLDNPADQLTNPGDMTGTPGYFAPETISMPAKVDGRADIYALGCVAWWLLTGNPVFAERSPVALAYAHLQRTPPDIRSVDPTVPPELGLLVNECLSKDPEGRPNGARAMMARLRGVFLEQPWTPRYAEAWWQRNLPELCDLDTANTVPPRD